MSRVALGPSLVAWILVTEPPGIYPRELTAEEEGLLVDLLSVTGYPKAIDDPKVGLRDQMRNGELTVDELKWIIERQRRLDKLIDEGIWTP